MEMLRGHTSGFAVPTYVIDAPGGGGKIPVGPQYLISMSESKVILRNYEGIITTYDQPVDKTSECHKCGICSDIGDSPKKTGLEKLFCEQERSLVPAGNDRRKRRKIV